MEKIWADWKTKTKKKKTINCTGGGQSSSRLSLTPTELRILGIMGVAAVVGLSVVEERGFDAPPLSTQDNITQWRSWGGASGAVASGIKRKGASKSTINSFNFFFNHESKNVQEK